MKQITHDGLRTRLLASNPALSIEELEETLSCYEDCECKKLRLELAREKLLSEWLVNRLNRARCRSVDYWLKLANEEIDKNIKKKREHAALRSMGGLLGVMRSPKPPEKPC
jgi:hypothetical protein